MPRTNDAVALPVYSITLSSSAPLEYAAAGDLLTPIYDVHPQGSWVWIVAAGASMTTGMPMPLADAGNAAAALRELRADDPTDGVADVSKSYSTSDDLATRDGANYTLIRTPTTKVDAVDGVSLDVLLEVLDDLAAAR